MNTATPASGWCLIPDRTGWIDRQLIRGRTHRLPSPCPETTRIQAVSEGVNSRHIPGITACFPRCMGKTWREHPARPARRRPVRSSFRSGAGWPWPARPPARPGSRSQLHVWSCVPFLSGHAGGGKRVGSGAARLSWRPYRRMSSENSPPSRSGRKPPQAPFIDRQLAWMERWLEKWLDTQITS